MWGPLVLFIVLAGVVGYLGWKEQDNDLRP